MTDKEKLEAIRAEIERFRKTNKVSEDKEYAQYELDVKCGYDMALDDMLSYINSLSEEPVSEDICNQCEAHNDKDKCDELVFGHKCPIVTTSEDLEEASEEYTSKVLERTNVLIGNQPVGEEIEAAFKAGAQWQKQKEINEIRAEIKRRYEHHLGCMEGSRDDTYPEISHAHHCAIKTELFEILCFLDVLEGKSDVSEANFGKIKEE